LSRILAIDFGLKRSGIAVTDNLKIIASSLASITTDKLMGFLDDYLQKENVDTIVVGYPLNLDGTLTHVSAAVDEFIGKLSKKFPKVKIEKEDERLTSKMAVKAMVDGGVKKMKRRDKGLIDKVSATLILQSYLENYNR
jgi:putative holliday junction resolvase